MHSVTSRAQTDYVSAASTPSSLFKPHSIDLSGFSYTEDVYPPFKDFCENGIVPESEAIQSSIASCCLKYQTPQVLAALLENGEVKTLNLSGTFLDDKSAVDLASLLKANTTLQRIYLADNDFGTEGFSAICGALEENANLIVLDLSQNDGDGSEYVEAIARMVAKNSTLEILELGICRIDAEKLPILAKALEENLALTQLGLGFNLIGPEGISTLLKIVEKKPFLKVLDLSGNKIGAEGGKLVAEILKTNTTLIQLDLAYNYLAPRACSI
jgi:Ran GTPase-activating protein (RanGAP) involved in mRNA processing and transport